MALRGRSMFASAVFVSQLQQALKVLGFFEGDITGVYDDATTAAVAALQRDLGLPDTGHVRRGHRRRAARAPRRRVGRSAPASPHSSRRSPTRLLHRPDRRSVLGRDHRRRPGLPDRPRRAGDRHRRRSHAPGDLRPRRAHRRVVGDDDHDHDDRAPRSRRPRPRDDEPPQTAAAAGHRAAGHDEPDDADHERSTTTEPPVHRSRRGSTTCWAEMGASRRSSRSPSRRIHATSATPAVHHVRPDNEAFDCWTPPTSRSYAPIRGGERFLRDLIVEGRITGADLVPGELTDARWRLHRDRHGGGGGTTAGGGGGLRGRDRGLERRRAHAGHRPDLRLTPALCQSVGR